jgi:hypothetical protein
MLTSMPTRFLPSTGAHSAYATPWLESALHTLDAHRSLLIHAPDAPRTVPPSSPPSHFVPTQPHRLTPNSFQSP